MFFFCQFSVKSVSRLGFSNFGRLFFHNFFFLLVFIFPSLIYLIGQLDFRLCMRRPANSKSDRETINIKELEYHYRSQSPNQLSHLNILSLRARTTTKKMSMVFFFRFLSFLFWLFDFWLRTFSARRLLLLSEIFPGETSTFQGQQEKILISAHRITCIEWIFVRQKLLCDE